MKLFTLLFLLAATMERIHGACLANCTSGECVFEFSLDVYASETGYFKVKGCDEVMPTLLMEVGVEYTFLQKDPTNWMHPLGFGYFPDGAHKDVDELEPAINPYDSSCIASETCQHPKYYQGTTFLGVPNTDDFGLDVYEPLFQRNRDEWLEMEEFNVKLTITDPTTKDIFYICHVHDAMSGRIKLIDSNGALLNPPNEPALGYEYQTISSFDKECGTHDVSDFQGECSDVTLLCGAEQTTFGKCMHALDCAMHVEMRVNLNDDPITTFMHQMIPHHRNAVNMAKALLKQGVNDEELESMLWNIVNTQNAQNTYMRKWLKANGKEQTDLCDAESTPIQFPSVEVDQKTTHILIGVTLGIVSISLLALFYIMLSQKGNNNSTITDRPYKSDDMAQA